jgi:hypothetical protein
MFRVTTPEKVFAVARVTMALPLKAIPVAPVIEPEPDIV